MTKYAFPRDLLEAIKTRWQTAAKQQFELPEDRILHRLLDTCYHAHVTYTVSEPLGTTAPVGLFGLPQM